ncbi:MAG: CHAT domain-containing protein [Chloroflexus sp.]
MLITTSQGSLAPIVPHSASDPLVGQLDAFTADNLDKLLIEHRDDQVVGGYLYGQLANILQLETSLAKVLPLLGEHLIGPLAQQLRVLGATGVTLIPTDFLSLLPLHAASYTVDGVVRCLLDEFDVAYAPSVRVLAIA